jgi:hypothetical protein
MNGTHWLVVWLVWNTSVFRQWFDIIYPIVLELDSSSRTLALGLTQLLTEMSTRNISWG